MGNNLTAVTFGSDSFSHTVKRALRAGRDNAILSRSRPSTKKPDALRDSDDVTLGNPAFLVEGPATFCPYLTIGLAGKKSTPPHGQLQRTGSVNVCHKTVTIPVGCVSIPVSAFARCITPVTSPIHRWLSSFPPSLSRPRTAHPGGNRHDACVRRMASHTSFAGRSLAKLRPLALEQGSTTAAERRLLRACCRVGLPPGR